MKNQVNYASLQEKSNRYGETKDCAVKAVAVVLNTSYEDAHILLKKFGRKDGDGTNFYLTTKPALQSRGFEVKRVEVPSYIKTVRNLEESFLASSFKNPVLITTSKHIIGFRNGKAEDYTSGRKFRILDIHEIIPTENAIYSIDVGVIKPSIRTRKKEEFKYALANKETKVVYRKFKRAPSFRIRNAINSGNMWITGQKKETIGKLEIIEI